MTLRTLLLATTIAALALPSPAARAGFLEDALGSIVGGIFGGVGGAMGILEILQMIVTTVEALPDDPTLEQLHELSHLLGEAERSYLRLVRLARALDDLYPDEPDLESPEDIILHAGLRHLDRKARVLEAMRVAATLTDQRGAIDARIEALAALNRSPAGNLAAQQIGNEAILQVAASVEMLTRLTAELGQLEGDQRAQEDWSRLQASRWMEHHYARGFWTGERTWTPETFQRGF